MEVIESKINLKEKHTSKIKAKENKQEFYKKKL